MAVDLCSWRGYANKSGTLVNTTDYITVHGAKSSAVTIFTNGYYTADVEKGSAANISFKICGEAVAQGEQVFTCPVTTLNILNISITSLSSSASCSYNCACSGGHCCSGATEYTDGSGNGTCQSSACTAPTTTPTTAPGGGGGGGGGGNATTTTKITTTIAVTTTTTPIQKTTTTIQKTTTTMKKPPKKLEIPGIPVAQVVGIVVAVVAVLALVVFIIIRVQTAKTIELKPTTQ